MPLLAIGRYCLVLLAGLSTVANSALASEPVPVAVGALQPPYVIASDRGILVDLLYRVFDQMRVPVQLQFAENGAALNAYRQDQAQAMAPISLDHLAGHYSEPLITFHNDFFTLAEQPITINDFDDLAGLRVMGFNAARQILPADFDRALAQASSYREEDDQVEQVRALMLGQVDVIVADRLIFTYSLRRLQQQQPLDPRWRRPWQSWSVLPPNPYRVVFHDRLMAVAFDRALLTLDAAGERQRLQQRYERLLQTF